MKTFFSTVLFLFLSGVQAQQIPDTTKQQNQLNNLIVNAGFENGKAGWAVSGGTFAITTSSPLFGKQMANFTASAGTQYFESSAVTVPVGLQGQDCLASMTYNGGSANLYLSVFDGSSVELIPTTSRATLSAASGQKVAKLYFTCPSSGSVKIRVVSTASSAIGSFDNFILDKSDAVPVKQAQFVGDFTVTTGSSVAFTSATYTEIPASATGSYAGGVSAPTGTRIGVKIGVMPKGRYQIMASGFRLFNTTTTNSGGEVSFSSSDIATATVCGQLTAQGNVGGSTDGRAGATFICEYEATSDLTNKDFVLKGLRVVNGATLEWSVGAKISVYYYPSGSDSVINSKCINDINCENVFTAFVSSAGAVSGENLDWINGNCTGGPNFSCTLNSTLANSNQMICHGTSTENGVATTARVWTQNRTASNSTTVAWNLHQSGAGNVTTDSNITCIRQGSDYKPKQNLQAFLSSTVTSAANNLRVVSAFVNNSCNASPCTIDTQSGEVSSITRAATGRYTVNFTAGTFSNVFHCGAQAQSAAGNPTYIASESAPALTNTAFSFRTLRRDTHAEFDERFSVFCIGVR